MKFQTEKPKKTGLYWAHVKEITFDIDANHLGELVGTPDGVEFYDMVIDLLADWDICQYMPFDPFTGDDLHEYGLRCCIGWSPFLLEKPKQCYYFGGRNKDLEIQREFGWLQLHKPSECGKGWIYENLPYRIKSLVSHTGSETDPTMRSLEMSVISLDGTDTINETLTWSKEFGLPVMENGCLVAGVWTPSIGDALSSFDYKIDFE